MNSSTGYLVKQNGDFETVQLSQQSIKQILDCSMVGTYDLIGTDGIKYSIYTNFMSDDLINVVAEYLNLEYNVGDIRGNFVVGRKANDGFISMSFDNLKSCFHKK